MSKAQRRPTPLGIRLGEPDAERPSLEQQERYQKAVSLLRQWREDDEGEDDGWALVEEELKSIRMQLGR